MKAITLVALLGFLAWSVADAQSPEPQKFTVSGYIRDAGTGEELLYANVLDQASGAGVTTNPYGFYSLTLPAGRHTLTFSYVGYEIAERTVALTADLELNVALSGESTMLSEVVVTGEEANRAVNDVRMSRIEMEMEQIKRLPALLGEPDLIKTVQTLPGVTSAGEGTSSFFVRGGSADQNLILIDEAPVYEVSHLFGIFSVFNADIIKSAELYKGGIPARYGGRLSSLLEVTTRDGNNRRFGGSGGLGLLAAKLTLEGPVVKDEASFIVSGRRSYADLFMPLFDELEGATVKFHDLNAKINWKKDNNNRFFLAGYSGRDIWKFSDDFQMDWGNTTGTFRWNHLFNDRLFGNTTVIYSDFDYVLESFDSAEGFRWDANQREVSLKEDLTYFLSPRLTLQLGYQGIYRRFTPGVISPNTDESIFKETKLQKQFALEHGLYAGMEHRLGDRLRLEYGLRLSAFQQMGKGVVYDYADPAENVEVVVIDSTTYGNFETMQSYANLEPRLAARYALSAGSSLKFSYNRMVQYVHLISNSTVPVPFSTWAPSAAFLRPQKADQAALGYFRNFRNDTYEFSIEGYYKSARDVTEFADNAELFFNEHLATEFRQGDAESYGIELFLQKKKGDLRGFASYTWSRTTMEVPGVNDGRPFAANHDRRHNLNLALNYQLTPQWSVGGNFTYATGRPITLPTGKYQISNYQVNYYSERNGYRLPDFHRLDLSATYSPRQNDRRKWKQHLSFGLYNAYNRQNPFTIYTRKKQDEDGNVIGDGSEKEARLVYLFGALPYLSWNFEF